MATSRALARALFKPRPSMVIGLQGQGSMLPIIYSAHRVEPTTGRNFHQRAFWLQQPTAEASNPSPNNPVSDSMAQSNSPTGQEQAAAQDFRHAAFLGEADSNDGHESFRDAYAKPHEAMDASNAAFLGEGDSNDSFEIQQDIEGHKAVPLDAKNAAFLGEADSDDAFEMDIIENPEAHRHQIDPEEAKNAAFLGEADSSDAHEADREVNPGKYQHKTEDMSTSGLHGETGSHDQ